MAKKRANGEGTVFQRSNGTWEAKVTIGFDAGTGKQIQRSVYGKTQREANDKRLAILDTLKKGTYRKPSKKTVSQWLDEWYNSYTINLKMYTRRNYLSKIQNHINPYIGAVKLDALRTIDIQNMYNVLNSEKHLAPKTIREIHGILHHALQKAIKTNEMSKTINPSDECKECLPKVIKSSIHALENSELQEFLNTIKGDEFEYLYIVDLFTGMRKGEILGLQWQCINFSNRTIRIDKQLYQPSKGKSYTLETTKHDKVRTLTVAKTVIDALKKQKSRQLAERLKAGELWDEGSIPDLVFRNPVGGHLAHATVYRHFKDIVTKMGLPETRFHDMRHSYAILSIRAGDDPVTIQTNMGHHSPAFTLQQYGHCTEEMKSASANRFEDYIQKLT